MQGEEKGQQNLYFHGCGHVPWEWRHWGFFSSFPAGLLGHSADCCPFTSCPTSNDWDFLWTNDPPSPGTLAKGKGSIRNSSRAVSGSGLSAQCSEGRAVSMWTPSGQLCLVPPVPLHSAHTDRGPSSQELQDYFHRVLGHILIFLSFLVIVPFLFLLP